MGRAQRLSAPVRVTAGGRSSHLFAAWAGEASLRRLALAERFPLGDVGTVAQVSERGVAVVCVLAHGEVVQVAPGHASIVRTIVAALAHGGPECIRVVTE
mgnify:CR=1 FL=1